MWAIVASLIQFGKTARWSMATVFKQMDTIAAESRGWSILLDIIAIVQPWIITPVCLWKGEADMRH